MVLDALALLGHGAGRKGMKCPGGMRTFGYLRIAGPYAPRRSFLEGVHEEAIRLRLELVGLTAAALASPRGGWPFRTPSANNDLAARIPSFWGAAAFTRNFQRMQSDGPRRAYSTITSFDRKQPASRRRHFFLLPESGSTRSINQQHFLRILRLMVISISRAR